MNKVYVLYNWDSNEIIAISQDRGLIEEIMCDCFIDDLEYQWYWDQYYDSYKTNDPRKMAELIWTDMLEWYDGYIGIYEEVLI